MTEGLAQEMTSFTGLVETNDAREGVLAFLEKRKPQFSDN